MVLPGIQTLFGFQLIAVFNARFSELDTGDRVVHLSALMLIALAIALIMTPAAYHRISEQGRTSVYFTKLASTLIAAAMLPLLIGLGVRKLSVGAARLPDVAQWITGADSSVCAALADQALQAVNLEQAQAHVKAP